ncbi:MAG: hypothetical protein Q9202_001446 [Teloschistes flavicans]
MASQPIQTVKTRFCIISDTHTTSLFPSTDSEHSYRDPLPTADVLLHAGDITTYGLMQEYRPMFEMLCKADAELKIVIAGNHDITLDEHYYQTTGRSLMHGNMEQDTDAIKAMWTGQEAQNAGIIYLEEGISTFTLKNGARFTIYTSPYQPEFCNWAFPYERDEDRFNPVSQNPYYEAKNPIPSFPAIDIIMTHGPPAGILDETQNGDEVGCEHLMHAVRRCRPRLHCFGHIHEGWGAQRTDWIKDRSAILTFDPDQLIRDGCAAVDVSEDGGGEPLRFGQETLFVNAAIMNVAYRPVNAPFRVDLDLPSVARL